MSTNGDLRVPYVCGYVLEYGDRVEGQELHRGTREECERVAAAIPAIAVSGAERPTGAAMHVMAATAWDEMWAQPAEDSDAPA